MPRPKKSTTVSKAKTTAKKETPSPEVTGEGEFPEEEKIIPLYKRDKRGLLEGVDYKFNDDGSVNWRAMIKEEHLFVNKDWFESKEKEVPRSIEGLKDDQLLIKLAGIKDLAKLRGYSKVSYKVEHCDVKHVSAQCTIEFKPNFETEDEMVEFSSMANATIYNTSNFGEKFLDAIAENRAFVRCVRNFLGIHIAGEDEIDRSDSAKEKIKEEMATTGGVTSITPVDTLKKKLFDKFGCDSFSGFKEILRKLWIDEKYRNENTSNWEKFEDLKAKECREITTIIAKMEVD